MWLWMIAAPASMQASASAAISGGSTGTWGFVTFDVTPLIAHSMMTGSIELSFRDAQTFRTELTTVGRHSPSGLSAEKCPHQVTDNDRRTSSGIFLRWARFFCNLLRGGHAGVCPKSKSSAHGHRKSPCL